MTWQLLTVKFSWLDISVLIASGFLISIAQTLSFNAIKYEEPSKLS